MNNWGWYINDISLHKISHLIIRQGLQYKSHMLDNESREALKRKITGIGFICQLVPPRLILDNNIEQEI